MKQEAAAQNRVPFTSRRLRNLSINMKFVIVFVAVCIAFAMAAPAPAPAPQQEVQVLRYDSDVEPEGYKFL